MTSLPNLSAPPSVSPMAMVRRRYGELLERMPDALVLVDPGGSMVLVNAQAALMFGYQRDEMEGQSVEMLIPSHLHRAHRSHRADFFAQPRIREMGAGLDLMARRKDGSEFPVEISLSSLVLETGPLTLSAVRDMTERRRAERTLRETNEQLRAAALVKDRFLASMSHELRTPLNAIIGFAGTLLMELPGPLNADQRRHLSTIELSAQHLHSLINDLLDLAKIEAGKVELSFEPVPCRDVLAQVHELMRPAVADKPLRFDVELPPADCVIHTDRRALVQILLNLASNAIKFTPSGEVKVALQWHDNPHGPPQVAFSVSDTGVGIAAEDQHRLFGSFEQLGDRRARGERGVGLGLHLSQKLAALLGGRIECVSAPGEGSRFTLVLAGDGT